MWCAALTGLTLLSSWTLLDAVWRAGSPSSKEQGPQASAGSALVRPGLAAALVAKSTRDKINCVAAGMCEVGPTRAQKAG